MNDEDGRSGARNGCLCVLLHGCDVSALICTVCKRGAVICRCGVVWCCRPSWLPVVIVHQGDQGWGMLPWDYPVRVTWSSCNAFKGHVFLCLSVCVCVWLSVLSVVCECIPDPHLHSDLSVNCLWSSSSPFLFHSLPSLHPSSQSTDLRGKPHISLGCPSRSLSISPNQMFKSCLFVYPMELTLIDAYHKTASARWCHIPWY